MGILTVKSVSKSFGSAEVLKDVDFSVEEDEIFFVLGPSGCGKTTLLRIITGFLSPDRGKVLLSGRDITYMPPAKRNIGMVFQNYALWPHMNVRQNVGYGLEVKKLPSDLIKSKVEKVLEITKLGPSVDKFPPHLSGGQQQRVALARAIVAEPKVLLLDEPLSNLDAKLREEMRSEIRRIQRETRITMVYVTHDQKEAMSLGSRITVLDEGRIIQTGTPYELYTEPRNNFVASFLGDINIIDGRVASSAGETLDILTGEGRFSVAKSKEVAAGDRVKLAFRPENITFGGRMNQVRCRVSDIEYYGETFKVRVVGETGWQGELKAFSGDIQKMEKGSVISFCVKPENFIIFAE